MVISDTQIAVLITCHNRRKKTIDCLRALFNTVQNNVVLEVFLVDDASTDHTSNFVHSEFPAVHIINGNGHLYWNRGMHLAWKTASEIRQFDYYLWLNDDTMLFEDGIANLLDAITFNNDKTIVCGAISSPDSGKFTYGGKDKKGNALEPDGTFQSCFYINGNCVLVSKKVFEKIGMLNPAFPHAIGDYDYGLKCIRHGFIPITTKVYVGICEKNEQLPAWCYQNIPLKKRLRSLYSPLANSHPYHYFMFEQKHFGFFIATKHFFSIHLRALIPSLWNK